MHWEGSKDSKIIEFKISAHSKLVRTTVPCKLQTANLPLPRGGVDF